MFTERDLKMVKAVRKVIAEGDFLLKGRAVPAFVIIMQWLKELDDRVEDDLAKKPKKKPKKKTKKKAVKDG